MASHTPSKINIEPENDGLVQMNFPLNRGVFGFVGVANQWGWFIRPPIRLDGANDSGYRLQWKDSHKGLVYLPSNLP